MRLIDADEFKAVLDTPFGGDGPVRHVARTVIETVIRALDKEPTVACARCRNASPVGEKGLFVICYLDGEEYEGEVHACTEFKERQA